MYKTLKREKMNWAYGIIHSFHNFSIGEGGGAKGGVGRVNTRTSLSSLICILFVCSIVFYVRPLYVLQSILKSEGMPLGLLIMTYRRPLLRATYKVILLLPNK